MYKIQEIEAEIRRRLPRLMELSFGCEGIDELNRKYLSSSKYCFNNKKIKWCRWERDDGDTQFYPDQIIGHPIKLSEIKDIIKIKFKDKELRKKLFGKICEMWEEDKPFDQQSTEVHEFVANLIFHNK